MRKLTLSAIMILVSFATSFAATYYVDGGVDTDTGNGSVSQPKKYISSGILLMHSGDTLIVKDGVYTGNNNRIRLVPSGTPSGRTIVRAENNFGVILDGITSTQSAVEETQPIGLYKKSYVDIQGFIVKNTVADSTYSLSAITIYDCDHVRVMKCGVKQTNYSGTGKYGGCLELSYSEYCLLEDVFLCGDIRYGIVVYGATGSHHNILRRCVVRWDYSSTTQPRASIANYGGYPSGVGTPVGASDNNYLQNCIVIDGNDGSAVSSSTFTGGFSAPGINTNLHRYGCITLNNAGQGSHFSDFNETYGVGLHNCIMWDVSAYPIWLNRFANTESSLVEYCSTANGNLRGSTDITNDNFYNNIVINGAISNFTLGTGGNANLLYASEASSGYVYIIQSPYPGKGATIMYKYGVDGTLYGEDGWDILTSNSLWPFPYEDAIKDLFSETNTPQASAAPTANNTTRGFCAAGQTLTKYIWEYLGNPIPPEIYGSSLSGDLTGDSQVNIQDLQACVNHILGVQNWGAAADVNGDGSVNILDVQRIANIILGE